MMSRSWLLVIALCACTKAGTPNQDRPETASQPGLKVPAQPVTPAPPPLATSKVTVELASVTLADDCGGTAPTSPPVQPTAQPKTAKAEMKADAKSNSEEPSGARMAAKMKRRCEQTSMQLSVTSDASGAASELRVKKVELFDPSGKSLGELTPRSPTVWDANGSYVAWDEKIAPGKQLSVSYVLSQPTWGDDRWNKTYTLKAIITTGGTAGDQTVEKAVQVTAPAQLPPNVKT